MKRISAIVFFALMVLALACVRRKDLTITGRLKNLDKGIKTAYLATYNAGEMILLDSCELNVDEFIFRPRTEEPKLYQLLVGNRSYLFITQNGEKITFKADYRDTVGFYTPFGSVESENFVMFNIISYRASLANKKIGDLMQHAPESAQDSLWNIYAPKIEAINTKYAQDCFKYIEHYKNSLSGFYALMLMHDLDKEVLAPYEEKIIALTANFKKRFALNADVQYFANKIERQAVVALGRTAPNIVLNAPDGKTHKLSDLRGKYVLVDFWASWCGPCRNENPNVVKQYQRFKNKNFTVFGVSLDSDAAAWKKAIANDHLAWTHVSDLKGWESNIAATYQVESIPSSFLLDPQGKIIAKNLRGDALAHKLEELLK